MLNLQRLKWTNDLRLLWCRDEKKEPALKCKGCFVSPTVPTSPAELQNVSAPVSPGAHYLSRVESGQKS